MTIGIYVIRCTHSHMSYIGGSSNVEQRVQQHKRMLSNKEHWLKDLQRDWNLYPESFEFEIVEILNDVDKLPYMEEYWINKFAVNELYNKHNKPNFFSKEARTRCGHPKGVPLTEEHRAKVGRKGPRSPEHVAKLVENCRKLSSQQKGQPKSEEHRAKIAEVNRQRPRGPDGRFKPA